MKRKSGLLSTIITIAAISALVSSVFIINKNIAHSLHKAPPKSTPTPYPIFDASQPALTPPQSISAPLSESDPLAGFSKLKIPAQEILWEGKTSDYDIMLFKNKQDNTVYFVADIKLKDISQLKAAFANGSYGSGKELTTQTAQDNRALIAINCDNYSFRTDGIVIRNGELFRDKPTDIDAFIINKDGTAKIVNEKGITGKQLLDEGAFDCYLFGPALVDGGKAYTDFSNKSCVSKVTPKNPRTGIGYVEKNHFVFVVADGRKMGYSIGFTLSEFAKLFEDLGCEIAYNFDGGQTSSMAYKGELVNNPLGNGISRAHSDILYVGNY